MKILSWESNNPIKLVEKDVEVEPIEISNIDEKARFLFEQMVNGRLVHITYLGEFFKVYVTGITRHCYEDKKDYYVDISHYQQRRFNLSRIGVYYV